MRIRNPQDFWAGLMFIGFGLLTVIVARDYPLGSAMRMGPGYFPTWLGSLMIVLGAIVAAMGIRTDGERVTPFAWRPMILLSLSFLLFGYGVDHLGFVPALIAVAFLSSAAGKLFRPVEAAILAVGLAALGVGVFVYGIGLPYRLFWWS
jgi:hypothetical protein